jgi:hypothetical protein
MSIDKNFGRKWSVHVLRYSEIPKKIARDLGWQTLKLGDGVIQVAATAAQTRWWYVGVLISLWLFQFPVFLFAAQPKEFFSNRLKKLEQRGHQCVELRGNT